MWVVSHNSKQSKWCSYLNAEWKVVLSHTAVKSWTHTNTGWHLVFPRFFFSAQSGLTGSSSQAGSGKQCKHIYCTNVYFQLKPRSMKCTRLPHDTTQAKSQSLWGLLEVLHPVCRQQGEKRDRGESATLSTAVSRKYLDLFLQMRKQRKSAINQIREN